MFILWLLAMLWASSIAQGSPVHSYELIGNPLPWSQARDACASRKTANGVVGYLAAITSQAEQDTVTALVTGVASGAWVGGTDVAVDGTWVWQTLPSGPKVFATGNFPNTVASGFNNFYNGEPNDFNSTEDCMMVYPTGKWNDLTCAGSLPYVCEYDDSAPPEPPFTAPPIPHSYELIRDPLPWSQARIACANRVTANGVVGYLAAITHQAEQDTVTALMRCVSSGAWVGGTDAAVEGTWVWQTLPSGPKLFVTGNFPNTVASGYNNFYYGEPNDFSSTEDCMMVYDSGKWNDLACETSLPYVCEYDDFAPPEPLPTAAPIPHSYEVIRVPLTWSQARDACANRTAANGLVGHLAAITSQAEQDSVTSLMGCVASGAWVGGTDAALKGTWVWQTPSGPKVFVTGNFPNTVASGYNNFYPGEPNDFNSTEDCMMVYDTGKWNDMACETTLPYVCQYGLPLRPPSPPAGGGSGGLIAFILIVVVLGGVTAVYAYKFPDDARSKLGAARDFVAAGVSKITSAASQAAQYRPLTHQDPGDFQDEDGFDDAFRIPADDAPVLTVNSTTGSAAAVGRKEKDNFLVFD